MSSQEFIKTMEYIIQAMREKGYDPYQQLKGYLLENEPGYITRYKDARLRKKHIGYSACKKDTLRLHRQ